MRALKLFHGIALASAMTILPAQAQTTPDGDAVVAAVKARHTDFRALCQQGPDGVRAAVMQAIQGLVAEGKLQGSPQAAGAEAGARLGRECRG